MNPLLYSNGVTANFAEQILPSQGDLGVGHFTSFRARRIDNDLLTLALTRHIDRLKAASQFFSNVGMRSPSSDEVLETLSKAGDVFIEQTLCDARVRITYWRDRWDLLFTPIEKEQVTRPISLYPVRCVRPLPTLKTCSAISSVYANSVALAERFDEALLIDPDSTVRESGWGNFGWFCKRGILHFTSDGVLPGVTEELVRGLANALSIKVERDTYSLDDVMENIQAGFITTSVRGIVEVSRVGDLELAFNYPTLQLLTKRFEDPAWWREVGTAL